ncbi:hypothetical protein G7072_04620 [Nocardioides sp. HDW12B]|uniref:hypothetical protein n=1 Tax=Nocardioides sp. HDW12B TaxID=2714939 RepID=UPI0014076F6F|nr:hypothetical protein [Nocardioides sp. HDW12B]QIK65721.1 hypothetical protein G7072_04620 [Nocardioides sp. HDW12B]
MVEDVTGAVQGRCGDVFRLYAEIYALRLVEPELDTVVLAPDEPLVELLPAATPVVPEAPR